MITPSVRGLGNTFLRLLEPPETGRQVCTRALTDIKARVARGERCAVVFDVDNTLVDTRARTLAAAKTFGQEPYASASIEQMQLDGASTARHLGVSDPTQIAAFQAHWEAFFWAPESFAHDRVIAATLELAHEAKEAGAEVFYLTGRNTDYAPTTRAQLSRAGFPDADETHVMCKPKERSTPDYNVEALSAMLANGVHLGWFMTEGKRDIRQVQLDAPKVPCVRFDFPLDETGTRISRRTPLLTQEPLDTFTAPTRASLLNDAKLTQFRRVEVGPPKALTVDGVAYEETSGRPVTLGDGAIVEGSIDHGGMQPHYVVDLDHPSLKRLLAEARLIGAGSETTEEQIAAVSALVRGKLKHKAYDSAPYLQLMTQQRARRQNVNLGDYIDQQSGVCREHGMMTHLALQAAGFHSEYVYASARQGAHVEDHGVATVVLDGERFVVDAYNENFDGFRLVDLSRKEGSRKDDPIGGWAHTKGMYGCALELTDHPRYWLPVIALPSL